MSALLRRKYNVKRTQLDWGKSMKKVPKVLMLVENLPVPGDPRVWAEATALREAGVGLSIICPKGLKYDESHICIEGIHIYRYQLPTHTGRFRGYLVEYCVALLKTFMLSLKVLIFQGFDVIHAANPPDLFFIIGIFYRFLGKKYLFDQHDPTPELFLAKFKGRSAFLQKLLLFLEYWSYLTAHLVITSNLSQKMFAMRRGHCPPQKVFVVRNGPNLQRMRLVPVEPEMKMGRRYMLVYVGMMGVQDGIEYILKALHHLIHNRGRCDVSLVLVGDGDRLPELRALAHNLLLDSYVYFTGWVDPKDVARYLSTADIGLIPDPQNGMNEFCTMVKTMEYMALGKPIVAFDLAETRFSAQEAALYAIPNQAEDFAKQIEILLDNEEARHRMGAIGQKRVEEELSWQHSQVHLLAAYKVLLGTNFGAPEIEASLPDPDLLPDGSYEANNSALSEHLVSRS
jgi:glycosyltransferase involved in cell wall biosynthesis